MIKMYEIERRLNLEPHLSLDNLMRYIVSQANYDGDYISYDSQHKRLIIREETGNANISVNQLIYYPTLAKFLRSQRHYPLYTAEIDLNDICSQTQNGIAWTITALEKLDDLLLSHRIQKAKVDAAINNNIILYGQQKTMPIYQWAKPYYCNYRPGIQGRILTISGIRYYTKVLLPWHRKKLSLYHINPRELLSNYGLYVKHISGGITNTPILIIRCAKSYKHKGKYYYLDLYTKQIIEKLSIAKSLAHEYAGHKFTIDIFEKRNKHL